jgi:hypothetical protein
MGFQDTAETKVAQQHEPAKPGEADDWLDNITPRIVRAGEHFSMQHEDGGVRVNMKHKPNGGEVLGMRETMGRMKRQLVEAGNDPAYADKIVRRCATRMDRRLKRGPKR